MSRIGGVVGAGAAIASLCGAVAIASGRWVAQESGTTAEFRGLAVVSPTVVWASGTGGRVARTVDGGTTWRVDTVPGATGLDFRDIAAIDENVAFAMSAGEAEKGLASIHRTDDGGATWTRVYTTDVTGVFLDALAFWTPTDGIAMSDPIDGKWYLLTTGDGGRSWRRIPPDALPPMLPGEAAFAASGTSLVVQGTSNVWIASGGGERARVFRSTDRGQTWSVADTPVHSAAGGAGIFSIAFTDAMRGVVVGGDYRTPRGAFPNVALTSDGGRSWRLADGPLPPGYMSAVSYVPGTSGRTLVAVGLAGTAVSLDGGSRWSMVDSVAYNSTAFASAAAGWTVGPRGRFARWEGEIAPRIMLRK